MASVNGDPYTLSFKSSVASAEVAFKFCDSVRTKYTLSHDDFYASCVEPVGEYISNERNRMDALHANGLIEVQDVSTLQDVPSVKTDSNHERYIENDYIGISSTEATDRDQFDAPVIVADRGRTEESPDILATDPIPDDTLPSMQQVPSSGEEMLSKASVQQLDNSVQHREDSVNFTPDSEQVVQYTVTTDDSEGLVLLKRHYVVPNISSDALNSNILSSDSVHTADHNALNEDSPINLDLENDKDLQLKSSSSQQQHHASQNRVADRIKEAADRAKYAHKRAGARLLNARSKSSK